MATSDRRIRIAVIPEQFPRGPDDFAGVFTRDYIAAIGLHCDVTVVLAGTGSERGLDRRVEEDGVEYVTVTPALRGEGARRHRLGRLEALCRIGRLAPTLQGVDLIHAHGAVFHGVPAVRLGRRLGVPVVLTIHTGPFAKLSRRRSTRYLTKRTLERADCVCVVSEDLRRQIEDSGIKPRRIEVTYNPVDTNLFTPSPSRDPRHRILFAGRLEDYKGGLRVVRAFSAIAERLPGWRLTIAGDGPERPAIEHLISESRALDGRVELSGPFTKPQLADLLALSDFFVYPSRHETFGLVLAEAMSAGLPVVAPDRTAPPEFVDERTGVLVPPDDLDAIARAMENVALNLDRYDRGVIRQRVVERFGLEAFGERLLAIYRSGIDPTTRHGGRQCAG
jgi:glycosyltransferase involved in cell wall biosynthesis